MSIATLPHLALSIKIPIGSTRTMTPTPPLSDNHTLGTVLATADLLGPKNLRWIFSLLTAPPMPAPNHIIITKLAYLSEILCTPKNWGEAQDKPTPSNYYDLKLMHCAGKKGYSVSLLSTQAFKEPLHVTHHVRSKHRPRATVGSMLSLFRPKPHPITTVHASLSQQNHQIPFLAGMIYSGPPPLLSNSDFSLSPQQTESDPNSSSDFFLSPQQTESDPNSSSDFFLSPQQTESDPNKDNMLTDLFDTHDLSVPVKLKPTALSQPHTQNSIKQKRMSQLPTRRSRRLQERQETSQNKPKHLSAIQGKTSKLPFDLCSNLTPLESGNTLQILHATELHITKEIEKMIDEAIRQDQATDITDQTTPSTPLHDPVPPLVNPGEELLL